MSFLGKASKAITSSNASEALGKVEKKSTLMEDTLISVTNCLLISEIIICLTFSLLI